MIGWGNFQALPIMVSRLTPASRQRVSLPGGLRLAEREWNDGG